MNDPKLKKKLAKAEAACAEMRGVIHRMYHYEDDERSPSIDKEAQHALSIDCGQGWHSPEEWDALVKERGQLKEQLVERDESLAVELNENLQLFNILGLKTAEDFGNDTSTAALRKRIEALVKERDELRAAMETAPCKCVKNTVLKCPQCGGELRAVINTSLLNDDQFDACKAGDFCCESCKSDQAASGHRYFWDRELEHTVKECARCKALAHAKDEA